MATVKIRNMKDLLERKWKVRQDGNGMYLGDSKHPDFSIGLNVMDLLGDELQVARLDRRYCYVFTDDEFDDTIKVPFCMLVEKPKKMRVSKTIFRNEVASFNGYCFSFPCSARNPNIREAREIAEWILKVTK